MKPSIIQGVQTEGGYQYPYVGLAAGKCQYRVYADRSAWFVGNDRTPTVPKSVGASQIRQALASAGREAFLEFLAGQLDKWKLKEMAGI